MNPRSHSKTPSHSLPDWVPAPAIHYLVHTESGTSIREIARQADVHASTILRQIRRFESRRDDPLVDGALRRLSRCVAMGPTDEGTWTPPPGAAKADGGAGGDDGPDIMLELHRVLRRLTEAGAILAVARDMETAVVLREGPDGDAQRTATVPRNVAQALALKEWIESPAPEKRVARYRITAAGRSALREMGPGGGGMSASSRGFGEKPVHFDPAAADPLLHHMRNSLAESPLVGLSRRRDRAGRPFLSRALVAAGERLREDFELAALLPGEEMDWLAFLEEDDPVRPGPPDQASPVAIQAHARVGAALRCLGSGLGEVALRVCCHLEGMETLEKRMDWSARSGKIVLRIALIQLARHYEAAEGPHGPMIG